VTTSVNTRTGKGGSRTILRILLGAACLVLLSASVVLSTGCTSEEDLVVTLLTTGDSVARREAAADLAGLRSLAATQRLAVSAETDETAAQGLRALRDEYIFLLNNALETARSAGVELQAKEELALQETVDCLAAIGDEETVEALGDVVCGPQQALMDSGGSEALVPDTLQLQLHCLAAVADAKDQSTALAELIRAASLSGDAISTVSIRDAAVAALQSRSDAVESLFQTRVAAGDDADVCAALDSVLAGIGQPAVETLVAAMGEQDWTDEILAQIGEPAVPRVAQELGSENARVRFRALGVLLRLFLTDELAVTTTLVDAEMVPALIDARSNATYGDERDAAAEAVLARIGEPAVEPLMNLLVSQLWASDVLVQMGDAAVPALTSALGSDDRDTRFAAADALVRIQKGSPEAVGTLTSDLQDENLKSIAAKYAYYIRLGQAGTEEVLAKALHKYGDKDMALDYLNCGNDALDAAAREWAADHGYDVYTQPGEYGGPQWGQGN